MTIAELDEPLYGFMTTHVLLAGDEAGIFDGLSNGSVSSTELARQLGLHEVATLRFLEAAASLGLVDKSRSSYRLSERLQPYLARNGARYIGGWLDHLRSMTTRSFTHLAAALRSGEKQIHRALGAEHGDTFELLYGDAGRIQPFADAMWNLGFDAAKELADRAQLSARTVLVDVGGGSGSFAIAAALRHPQLSVIVLDLPPLRDACERRIRDHGLDARVRFVAGDFFADPLPRGDAYALGYVLSDWSHERGTQLLEKVFGALEPGGCVLVLERLLDEHNPGPRSTALMDLCMLLETEGRHRTGSAYVEWLEDVGFSGCGVARSSADKHLIWGHKP